MVSWLKKLIIGIWDATAKLEFSFWYMNKKNISKRDDYLLGVFILILKNICRFERISLRFCAKWMSFPSLELAGCDWKTRSGFRIEINRGVFICVYGRWMEMAEDINVCRREGWRCRATIKNVVFGRLCRCSPCFFWCKNRFFDVLIYLWAIQNNSYYNIAIWCES